MQHTDLQLLRPGPMSHVDLGWKYDSITPVTHSADQIIIPSIEHAFLVKSNLKQAFSDEIKQTLQYTTAKHECVIDIQDKPR